MTQQSIKLKPKSLEEQHRKCGRNSVVRVGLVPAPVPRVEEQVAGTSRGTEV